jgi:molybdopterin converting factor small subunit
VITVRARLYASLRRYQPSLGHGEALEVELQEGSRIADLLEKLGVPKNETKQVFVSGRVQLSDYVLEDGEEVGIFPPIAGGNGLPLRRA